MTRKYKTHPTRRPAKRFRVELPYRADPLPNDEYWQDKANGQLVALMDIVGEDKAREMTAEIEGTWHEINDEIKMLVEHITADCGLGTHVIISGGEVLEVDGEVNSQEMIF